MLALVLVVPMPLSPATITVAGACTLPDAIEAANTDTPIGGCTAGSGSDTVELTSDVLLTEADNGVNGLPEISTAIEVSGAGFSVSRDPAAPDFRFFEVLSSGTLRLSDISLSSGSAPSDGGGAVYSRGTLSLDNTTITSSYATLGGAIALEGSSFTMVDSSLLNNHAEGYGGGIYNAFGNPTIINSEISDNYSGWVGGGVFSYGDAIVSGSTLSGNTGRGLFLSYSSSTISDSLISDNPDGGVFSFLASHLTLVNSTISGNGGSGVWVYQGFFDESAELIHTSVVANAYYGVEVAGYYTETEVILANSVVAYNSASGCGGPGSFGLDGSGNLDDDGSCPGSIPITGLDPVLADNGGLTQTHALLAGSSAIDAGGDCGLPSDQRGFGRESLCDSGAFEFDAAPPLGASVEGLNSPLTICTNLSTGAEESFVGESSWNCRSAGLTIESGERVRQTVRGRPNLATVRGTVEGVGRSRVICQNLSTNQSVQFALEGETSWECGEEGLVFSASDRVAWSVFGEAL